MSPIVEMILVRFTAEEACHFTINVQFVILLATTYMYHITNIGSQQLPSCTCGQPETAACNNRISPDLPLQTDAVVSCDFPITSLVCSTQDIRSKPVLENLSDAQNTNGLSFKAIGRSWAQLLRIDEVNDALNIAQVQRADMGCAQFRLIAELLVKSRAHQKNSGLAPDVSVVKPGYIVGTADGRVKPVLSDFIWR